MAKGRNSGAWLAVALALPWLMGNRGCELRTRVPDGGTSTGDGAEALERPDAGAGDQGASSAKPAAGKTCGGIAALTCAADEFCNYEAEAGGQGCAGNIADAAGACAPKPAACTFEYAPVCGCDRKTYPTRCAAHAAGASVLHAGECTVSDCEALGGRAVDGIGPPPECADGEVEHTPIVHDNGARSIEGTACCLPAP